MQTWAVPTDNTNEIKEEKLVQVKFHYTAPTRVVDGRTHYEATYLMPEELAESIMEAILDDDTSYTFGAKRYINGAWKSTFDTIIFSNLTFIEWPFDSGE